MDKIAAGIVLYNPEKIRIKENIEAILPQVDLLVLVDNGSSNIKEIEFEFNQFNSIVWIKNRTNLGIAEALNQIVKLCELKKYNWVLTLDQDSVSPPNLVSKYKEYTSLPNIGIMTPKIIDRNTIDRSELIKDGAEYEYVSKCITSASLINIQLCRNLDYFDVKMFIDLVDFEYCIRVRKAGYKILRANKVALIHQLGNLKVYNIFGKDINVTNHSVIRNYYHARNAVYYLKKHNDYVSSKDIYLRLCIKIIKILIFEKSKIPKLRAILSGVKTGLKM